jgi:hypothetical protein
MVSCLVIAWLLLATLTVVVAGVIAVGFAIALTNALLRLADACATVVGLALADGIMLYEIARGLAIGAVVAGVLGWAEAALD